MENKEFLSVSNSILAGAVLISLSIFLSGGFDFKGNSQTAAAINPESNNVGEVKYRSDAPTEGTGKVVVVEFADFQCPFCKNFYNETYKQLKTKYVDTGKIKMVYLHLPLNNIHTTAQKSAEASECANMQGKFWPYYEQLFSKGQADGAGLDVASLKSYASILGLDTSKFNTCLDSGQTAAKVKQDTDLATSLQITGTPTFFINGEKIVGAQPLSVFEAAIENALK